MPSIVIHLCLFLLALSPLASVSAADAIRIGVNSRLASWPLLIAEERGTFARREIEVQLVMLTSINDAYDRFDAGEIDLVSLTADQLLFAEEYGYDLRAMLLLGRSRGADVLVAEADIQQARALRGQRVAFVPAGVEELVVRKTLQRKGLALDDVEPVYRADDESLLDLIAEDRADAGVLQAPWNRSDSESLAVNDLWNSSSDTGLIMDVLAGDAEWIDRNKETLKAVIRTWNDSIAWLTRNPAGAMRLLAERLDEDPETIRTWLDRIDYLGTEENIEALRGNYQKEFSAMSETLVPALDSQERAVASASRYFSVAALRQVVAGR